MAVRGLTASLNVTQVNKEDNVDITDDKQNNMPDSESSGSVSFDYSNNNGRYIIKNVKAIFETAWSKASDQYIHFYNDPSSIKSVRLIKDKFTIDICY